MKDHRHVIAGIECVQRARGDPHGRVARHGREQRAMTSPLPDARGVWGRVLSDVAVYDEDRSVVPLREEDYSERGELIRTIILSDIKVLGGRRVPSRLECLPAKKKGRRTILQYHELEFGLPLDDAFFSYQRLQKGGG